MTVVYPVPNSLTAACPRKLPPGTGRVIETGSRGPRACVVIASHSSREGGDLGSLATPSRVYWNSIPPPPNTSKAASRERVLAPDVETIDAHVSRCRFSQSCTRFVNVDGGGGAPRCCSRGVLDGFDRGGLGGRCVGSGSSADWEAGLEREGGLEGLGCDDALVRVCV